MSFFDYLISEITLSNMSTIVGMLGGLLGGISFFEKYLIRFKPLFVLSDAVYIVFEKDHTRPDRKVTSIIIKFDIVNKRNKNGTINDLSLRVYHPDCLKPEGSNYFPFNELDKFPSNKQEIFRLSRSRFSSLNVLSRSSKTATIEFSQLHLGGFFNPKRALKMELYYCDEKGKWKEAFGIPLFLWDEKTYDNNEQEVYSYTVTDRKSKRDSIKKIQKTPESYIYKGVIDKKLRHFLLKPYYRFIKVPLFSIVNGFSFGILCVIFGVKHIIYKFLMLPIIVYFSKNVDRLHFSEGGVEFKVPTQKAFDLMGRKFTKIAKIINKKALSPEAKISVKCEKNKILIFRDKRTLKAYISGNGYIIVQDEKGYNNHRLMYSLEAKKFIFNIFLWKLNNDEFLSLESICIRIIDAFVVHSSY